MFPSPTPLRPGELFAGGFRLLAPLGAGGMGAVWVAEQLRTGKQRALKVMHPALVVDDRQRARFEQEASISSRIESDHVVEIIDAGVDPASGAPWIAMELLKGSTLGAAVEASGPFPLADAREVFAQLCHALGAAHDAGIVHRDLKPENVFLALPRRAGVRFTLKVLDFGIAKLVAESRNRATAAIGTPLWMAPEQTESGRAVSPATDVWSLGLLAFYALTGRSYWRGAHDDRGGTVAIMREIVMDPMPPASLRAAELGAPGVLPRGFDVWFAHATARDPAARYPDARSAGGALDALLAAALGQATQLPVGLKTPQPMAPIEPGAPGAPIAPMTPSALMASSVAPMARVTPLPPPMAPLLPGTRAPFVETSSPVSATPASARRGSPLRAVLVALIVVAATVTFGSIGLLLWNRPTLPITPPPPVPSRSVDPASLAIDEPTDGAAGTGEEEPLPSGSHSAATSTAHPPATWSAHPSTPTSPTAPPTTTRPSASTSTKPTSTSSSRPPSPWLPSTTPTTPTTTGPTSSVPPLPPPTASTPPLLGGFDRNAASAALARITYKDCGPPGLGDGVVHVVWAGTGAPLMVRVEGPYERTVRQCIRSRFSNATVPPFLDTPHALAWKITL